MKQHFSPVALKAGGIAAALARYHRKDVGAPVIPPEARAFAACEILARMLAEKRPRLTPTRRECLRDLMGFARECLEKKSERGGCRP
jgi:hypothetical protein